MANLRKLSWRGDTKGVLRRRAGGGPTSSSARTVPKRSGFFVKSVPGGPPPSGCSGLPAERIDEFDPASGSRS